MSLRLLHYSDIETAYDAPERIGRLAGLINERRDDTTLVIGTGDNLAPGVLSLVTSGQQALDFFSVVQPDIETLGNHDFDTGVAATRAIIRDSPQTWVAGNVRTDGRLFAVDEGLCPWSVCTAGDWRVGVVGVAHPETGIMNPNAAALNFTNPLSAVHQGIAAVRDRGVDVVVVAAHLGDGSAESVSGPDLAAAVDAAVVLDGHNHDAVVQTIEGTLYTRPGQGARECSEITVTNTDTPQITTHTVNNGPLASPVSTALRNRAADAGLTDIVTTVTDPISCEKSATHAGESRIGNFVVDAYRWLSGADIAVHAPSAIRAREPLTGKVTAWDLISLVPFADQLVVCDLDGEQLRNTLGRLSVSHRADARDWYFGHVSGTTIEWDETTETLRSATVTGQPIEPTARYTVATSEYYIDSDHLFPELAVSTVCERFGPQYEAIVDYAREQGIAPRLEQRIVRSEERSDRPG